MILNIIFSIFLKVFPIVEDDYFRHRFTPNLRLFLIVWCVVLFINNLNSKDLRLLAIYEWWDDDLRYESNMYNLLRNDYAVIVTSDSYFMIIG